jgi:hypothetical protein
MHALHLQVDPTQRGSHARTLPELQPEGLDSESRKARQPGAVQARTLQPAPPQEARSQGSDRDDDAAAGRKNVGVWHAQKGFSVICCCVADDDQGGAPKEACTYCGGSGWALPCPGCAGLGIVIDNSQRQPHQCEQCTGRRVQPMLALVPQREAS